MHAEVVQATVDSASMSIEVVSECGMEAEASSHTKPTRQGPREGIIDIREHDVPYYLLVSMVCLLLHAGQPAFKNLAERVKRADPVVMAYDIETTKAPLKFPDQALDQV